MNEIDYLHQYAEALHSYAVYLGLVGWMLMGVGKLYDITVLTKPNETTSQARYLSLITGVSVFTLTPLVAMWVVLGRSPMTIWKNASSLWAYGVTSGDIGACAISAGIWVALIAPPPLIAVAIAQYKVRTARMRRLYV